MVAACQLEKSERNGTSTARVPARARNTSSLDACSHAMPFGGGHARAPSSASDSSDDATAPGRDVTSLLLLLLLSAALSSRAQLG
jgi:hypothetical protein